MMEEGGVDVDPSTIMRWVHCYAPELEKRMRWHQGSGINSGIRAGIKAIERACGASMRRM